MTRLLAIDQGTTGTTSLVVEFTAERPPKILGRGYAEVPQHFPKPGWVEHDLDEIWASTLKSSEQALLLAKTDKRDLAALSLANQRETLAVWHEDGTPLHKAIVWQDRRTAKICQEQLTRGHLGLVRAKTGLMLDPYFTASKLAWLLEHDAKTRDAAKAGTLRLGTIDSWLIYKLTGGRRHRTDTTNAARTLLFDVHREAWDDELIALWGDIPRSALAEVLPSDETFGHVANVPHLPDGLPIVGVAGDQNAALIGQACIKPGMAKCTLGTGAFLLINTGDKIVSDADGLLGTIGLRTRQERAFALEGSIFVAGALVQWLRDNMRLIKHSSDIEALANEVSDCGGVAVVPALTGLGAPHWRSEARGLISGLSRGSTAAHLARACLEGIAMQTVDLAAAMQRAGGLKPNGVLRVDGGAAANNLLLQMHADGLGLCVERPACVDTTALGALYLGALGTGVFQSLEAVASAWQLDGRFEPKTTSEQRHKRLVAWHQRVAQA